MLAEKDYPLSANILAVMISKKIICEEITEVVKDFIERIRAQYERQMQERNKRR